MELPSRAATAGIAVATLALGAFVMRRRIKKAFNALMAKIFMPAPLGEFTPAQAEEAIKMTGKMFGIPDEVVFASVAQSNNLKVGSKAPSASVFELDGQKTDVLEFAARHCGARFVLNFGSFT